jgi:hypothetical protein
MPVIESETGRRAQVLRDEMNDFALLCRGAGKYEEPSAIMTA